MLPRRDGYDVCQAIRANRRLDGVKIMMLSAKCRELDRRKGLELGADDYVTKPFSTRDLVGRARALLGLPPACAGRHDPPAPQQRVVGGAFRGDRKSVVEGKSVAIRVDLGDRRTIQKK